MDRGLKTDELMIWMFRPLSFRLFIGGSPPSAEYTQFCVLVMRSILNYRYDEILEKFAVEVYVLHVFPQTKNLVISPCSLLFYRGRLRNVRIFITHLQSHCVLLFKPLA